MSEDAGKMCRRVKRIGEGVDVLYIVEITES